VATRRRIGDDGEHGLVAIADHHIANLEADTFVGLATMLHGHDLIHMTIHERPGIDALGTKGVDDPHMLARFNPRRFASAGGNGDEVKFGHG
jgi:hypothetical protein